ncbi:MAG: hypothetical protein SH818_10715 [Saprospiraceae bacterium]|nr:hypothetical protein [Saprospiraceae bacterium]
MKISFLFWVITILFPTRLSSQKKAEFESDFIMTNAQGRIARFTIGFDKNAYAEYEDTIFGEYNLYRPNHDIFFRDSFDVLLHPFNVFSYDRSIVQSLKCGEYEYGPLQLIIKVNTYMFPLILKWDRKEFSGICVARSYFEPSITGPLMGNYSDIILLRNLDSLIITNDMAKSIAEYPYFGNNNIDTVRFMNFAFRPQGASTTETQKQINPDVRHNNGRFVLNNVVEFHTMNIYSLDGRLLNSVRMPSIHSGEISIHWIPPNNNVYIVSLVGHRNLKSFKLYCY